MNTIKQWLLVSLSFIYSVSIFSMDTPEQYQSTDTTIYIVTADNQTTEVSRWQIEEMKKLRKLLGRKQIIHNENVQWLKKNNENTQNLSIVIVANMINAEELRLLIASLNAISQGTFEEFYNNLAQQEEALSKGKLRILINAAQRVQANGVSAFCLSYIMPNDMQKKHLTTYLIDEFIQKIPFTKAQILPEKQSRVNAIAFSPDGSKLVSAAYGNKNNLIVWDVTTWKSQVLRGHAQSVFAVAFSPDGNTLVSASAGNGNQNNLIVWDTQTWQSQALPSQMRDVYAIAFSPDGSTLVSAGGGQHNLMVWNTQTWQPQILSEHEDNVTTLVFSPNGNMLVSAGNGNQNNLIVWNTETWQPKILAGHEYDISVVAFSPDSSTLVSAGIDESNNLIVWNTQTWQPRILSGHIEDVDVLVFSPNGSMLVSAGFGSNLLVRNTATWKARFLSGHILKAYAATFSPDNSKLVSATYGTRNNLIVWDTVTWQSQALSGHTENVYKVIFSPDGSTLVSAGGDWSDENDDLYARHNDLIIWSFLSPQEKQALKDCTFGQAQFLYEIILAADSGITVTFESSYKRKVFNTLPEIIKNLLWKKFHVAPMIQGNQ